MQQRPIATTNARRAPPLGLADYATPVAWWGWSWEPPVPMSIAELVAAGDMDARTAAVCWLALAGHGSLLVAAEQPHSGKTTVLTALLDLVPEGTTRVYLRGGAETFDFVGRAQPATTLLLANELSSHLPVYLWGAKAVRAFRALREGFAIAATLHADSAAEAIARLRDELGVEPEDLARVDLLAVIRVIPGPQGLSRRIVSLDRLVPGADGAAGPRTRRLVEPVAGPGWVHDRAAEAALVAARHGWSAERSEDAIGQRASRISRLARGDGSGRRDAAARLRRMNEADEGGRS